jgi:plasmid stabilization system protein ParE
MEGEETKKEKKPRSEKQKAATAKALEALKARREIARDVIHDDMKKQVEEAEERIVTKVISRIKTPVEKAVVEEESVPVIKKVVPKKKVVVEESSSDEEVVIVRKKKPVVEEEKPPLARATQAVKKTTGNKLLDRLYGF